MVTPTKLKLKILEYQIHNNFGIYEILNLVNDKIYVGQTGTTFDLRWKYHVKDLLGRKHHNYRLQKDFRVYGIKAFSFRILEILHNKRQLLAREEYWIQQRLVEGKILYNIRKSI